MSGDATKPTPGISPDWRAVKPLGCEADDPKHGPYWAIEGGAGYSSETATGFCMTGYCSDAEARVMAAGARMLAILRRVPLGDDRGNLSPVEADILTLLYEIDNPAPEAAAPSDDVILPSDIPY